MATALKTPLEAPPKTWDDYVAEVTAECADIPEPRSPWRICRSDMIRARLNLMAATDPAANLARQDAFFVRYGQPCGTDKRAINHPDFAAAVGRAAAKAVRS